MSRGDSDAFNAFFDAYHTRLYRYILVVSGGNEALSKDCLQDAMIRIIRSIRPCDSERTLWSWLTRVMKSVFIDEMRKLKHRQNAVLPEDFWRESGSADNKLLVALDDAVSGLNEQERELVSACYHKRRTHRQLAEQMDTTPKAIESKLARIRVKLKSKLIQDMNHE